MLSLLESRCTLAQPAPTVCKRDCIPTQKVIMAKEAQNIKGNAPQG